MSEQARGVDRAGERARRRTARKAIGAYHEEQLRLLLDRVRDGFARMNTGEIDAFDLDEVIHRYSDADPYNPAGAQALYGNALGITATILEGAGQHHTGRGFRALAVRVRMVPRRPAAHMAGARGLLFDLNGTPLNPDPLRAGPQSPPGLPQASAACGAARRGC